VQVVLDSTSLDVHKTAGLRQKLDALGIDTRTHRGAFSLQDTL
jgi:hypothetical protein